MSTDRLDLALSKELEALKIQGRAKPAERVIQDYIPPEGKKGPRYKINGRPDEFIRLNSNSYLSLSNHPRVMASADRATARFGVGPGAVRFIDGTFSLHHRLEERIAAFVNKPQAKIFNSAYTANCGLALAVSSPKTHWIGDALNHNSIIRAMRISNVPSSSKGIFKHNDTDDLVRCLDEVGPDMDRVIVIFGKMMLRPAWPGTTVLRFLELFGGCVQTEEQG